MKLVNNHEIDQGKFGSLNSFNQPSINKKNYEDPNFNLIKDDIWQHELFISDDINRILEINQKAFLDLDIWNSDNHEIILRDNKKKFNDEYNEENKKLLDKYKYKIFPYEMKNTSTSFNSMINKYNSQSNSFIKTLTNSDSHKIMVNKPDISDIIPETFQLTNNGSFNNFFTALACIINSDVLFETNSLRRLIYPQINNFPCVSPSNIYFVKYFINGIRRNIAIDGKYNQSIFHTHNKELYPFFLEKALKKIYQYQDLDKVIPNLLLYRMIGWIPEILQYEDIGTCQQSYDKLKDSFKNFAIMLSFDYENMILPILDFISDDFENNLLIKTIIPSNSGYSTNSINQKLMNLGNAYLMTV